MDQFKNAKTMKNEWKYINEWRSKCPLRGWSYGYQIRRAKNFKVREKKGSGMLTETPSNPIQATNCLTHWDPLKSDPCTVSPPHFLFSANCYFRNIFSLRAICLRSLLIFLILFWKCSVSFNAIEYGKTQTRFFKFFGPWNRSRKN